VEIKKEDYKPKTINPLKKVSNQSKDSLLKPEKAVKEDKAHDKAAKGNQASSISSYKSNKVVLHPDSKLIKFGLNDDCMNDDFSNNDNSKFKLNNNNITAHKDMTEHNNQNNINSTINMSPIDDNESPIDVNNHEAVPIKIKSGPKKKLSWATVLTHES